MVEFQEMAAPVGLLACSLINFGAASAARSRAQNGIRSWVKIVYYQACVVTRAQAELSAGLRRLLVEREEIGQELEQRQQALEELHSRRSRLAKLTLTLAACFSLSEATRVTARMAVQCWHDHLMFALFTPKQTSFAKLKTVDSTSLLTQWQNKRTELLSQVARLRADMSVNETWHCHTMIGIGIKALIRLRRRWGKDSCRAWVRRAAIGSLTAKVLSLEDSLSRLTAVAGARDQQLELANGLQSELAATNIKLVQAERDLEASESAVRLVCAARETAVSVHVQCDPLESMCSEYQEKEREKWNCMLDELETEHDLKESAIRNAEECALRAERAERALEEVQMEVGDEPAECKVTVCVYRWRGWVSCIKSRSSDLKR